MKEILINRVFCGNYLDKKMGHEVINFMRADDSKHYLYIVPNGYIPEKHEEIESIIFTTPYKKNTVQVLAKATCLKQITTSKTDVEALSILNEYLKNLADKTTYNGNPLTSIFNQKENCSLISFIAEEMRKPLKPLYLSNDINDKKSNYYKISKDIGNQSQRVFLEEQSSDFEIINGLIEKDSLWEVQDSFLPVSELPFGSGSNDLNISSEKSQIIYQQMLNSFFDKINPTTEYDMLNPRIGDCFTVQDKGNCVLIGLRDNRKADFIDSNDRKFTLLFPQAFQNGRVMINKDPIIIDSPDLEEKYSPSTLESLRSLSLEENKKRFFEYLKSINTPDSSCKGMQSTAFKIWKEHGPDVFWNLVTIENNNRFEHEVLEELRWIGVTNQAQYLSSMRKFRDFVKQCGNNSFEPSVVDYHKNSFDNSELQKMDLDTISRVFRSYLVSKGYSFNTINTTTSNAFYIWRERGKEAFWNLVLKKEFEFRKLSKQLFLEFFDETDNRYNLYRSNLNRFREFYYNAKSEL